MNDDTPSVCTDSCPADCDPDPANEPQPLTDVNGLTGHETIDATYERYSTDPTPEHDAVWLWLDKNRRTTRLPWRGSYIWPIDDVLAAVRALQDGGAR